MDIRDDRRGDEGRSRARGRGAFVNYYDDLGISTTEEGYQAWKADETEYNTQKSSALSEIQGAQAKYDKAKAEHDGALARGWAETQKGMQTVRLVDKDNNILGTYKLPKGATDQLDSKLGNDTAYTEGGQNFNIVETGGVGESLSAGTNDMYASYKAQATPALAEAAGLLADYKGQIDNATRQIEETDAERARQLGVIQDDYAKKLETLKGIFGGK